ncbi:MAG TPA: hypothetical protein VGJ29_07930 [Vicinamibacterales bacterium]
MKPFRLFTLLAALAAAFGAQSLLALSQQGGESRAAAGNGPFDALHFRPIGPASMSGRIADIAVYEPNTAIFYVGTAHGGVWKTTNNGTTFEAQFQQQGLMSIGDVAVSQNNPDLVWVGTGESNNRQSTSWGDGVYKSTDGGKTYADMGLRTSRYINRIVIDSRNNDVVFVAATGSLWGPGGERGVFKTIDGGKTWKQTLKVDDDTGANDLVMDPTNDQILYATTYQRRRSACCMNGGGPGSGIWKSTDGGDTWKKLTSGLPNEPMGRIGVDVYRRRPSILYAVIEGQTPPGGRGAGGAGEAGAGGAAGETPEGRGARGGQEGRAGQEGQGGGRNNIVTGVNKEPTGLYRSDDAGATWRKVNNENPRPMYFSQVRVDPNDPDVVIYGGVDLHMTTDGGKTVNTAAATKIHSDHHAIWFDPSNSNHVMIGNDGGLAVSFDHAATWNFLPNVPVGLFYHVSYDMATPFHVCGGMQDNYVWCGPSAVRGVAGIANYQWTTMQGGDGFMALQDPADFRVAYSESQDGNMVRIDRVTNETMSIRPQAAAGEPPLRWEWDTPLTLSPHDPKIVYAPAQKVFRSVDRGLTWTAISPDLTTGANREDIVTMGLKGSAIRISKDDGVQSWPTIVSFAESPKRAGLLYAGADDGNLQVTRDAGKNWTNVTSKLPDVPKGAWVSRIAPSRFDEATVYATFDAHRQNDFETYVCVSHDYGQSWQSAAGNLKGEVIKTITEDLKNPDVLYLGGETGLFVSVDRGKSWTHVKGNLPTVRVDEITLHPRDNAMILATHGRALWMLDHLEPIQEYAAAQAVTTDAKLFTPPPSAMYRRPASDRNYEFWGDQTFFGENPPQAAVISWINKKAIGDVKLKITDSVGKEVREIAAPVLANSTKPGIQSACWDLRVQPAPQPPAPAGRGEQAGGGRQNQNAQETSPFGAGCNPGGGRGGGGFGQGLTTAGPFVLGGVYNVALIVDGKTVDTKPLRVTEDPEVVLTSVERKRLFDMASELHALQPRISDVSAAHASLTRQMTELSTKLNDVPADVKASFDALKTELAGLAPKLAPPPTGRGGGGGRGGAPESLVTKIGQAKNGTMAGMWPGEQTMKAYNDVKAQTPKAIADINAAIAKANALSVSLAKANLTLTVPKPIEAVAAPGKRTSTQH